jgi:hypothetical protein
MAKKRIKRRRGSTKRSRNSLRNKPIIVRDGITLEPMIRINVGEMSDEYIRAIHDDFLRMETVVPEGEKSSPMVM